MGWADVIAGRRRRNFSDAGWTPEQAVGFASPDLVARGRYEPWVVDGPAVPGRVYGWKMDMEADPLYRRTADYVVGLLYRMTGTADYVTELSLSVESIANEERERIERFHRRAAVLTRSSTGSDLPATLSAALLDRMRADDDFAVPRCRLPDSRYAVSFRHTRRDPRDPGLRAYVFEIDCPALAERLLDAQQAQ